MASIQKWTEILKNQDIFQNKLSIITIVFNGVEVIERTILSVLEQSFINREYIIIDGGSTDGTIEIIKKYEDKITYWCSEPDGGIYHAMNKGVNLATGEWVVFMNAGDIFSNNLVLYDIINFIGQEKDLNIVYGDAQIIDRFGKVSLQLQKGRHFDKKRSIIHQSMLIRRDHLKKNPYNVKYKILADYENLLLVSSQFSNTIQYVPITVCKYDKTGISSRPLYSYVREYVEIASKYMTLSEKVDFALFIIPRVLYSYLKRK